VFEASESSEITPDLLALDDEKLLKVKIAEGMAPEEAMEHFKSRLYPLAFMQFLTQV